ncbi:alginate lyase [Mucilaginibacter gracilis]|uniref:Alginate lyase n=1 Tax=Mucilaginibacter gracilis TaxID=423350 RepID=A0A495J0A1_9SPHI|nr:alginate lyase family protein [Mucilaginibacter gracilis]RKR81724.1 alginate lyase [Mucilaginibacter gracilis]
MMKKLLLVTLLLLPVLVNAQYVGLNDKEVQSLKDLIGNDASVKQLYNQYQTLADVAVNVNPNPIDTIRSEGLLKGNPKKTATAYAMRDMGKMYALAIVYRVSGEKNYLTNLGAYLTAWAKVNTGRGDPIDDTGLDQAIEAYDLVKAKLKPNDNDLIVKWFKQTADAEIEGHKKGMNKETSYNNWNSHRLKIVAMIAYAINNNEYKKYVDEDLKRQLEKNLMPDGSSVDFKLRDALHYHVYDLEPLLKLAIILKRATGVDEYAAATASGASIKKSVEWVVPYITGQKTHGEFVNSTVKFDQARAQNGEAEYKPGTLWDAKNGYKTLALAAYFDPQYSNTLKTVKATTNDYSDWQLVLNKVTQ